MKAAETPRAAARAARAQFEALFEGRVTNAIYPLLRIGLGLVFLTRHSDWLRPWFDLEHHGAVRGLMFYDSEPRLPALRSPWLLGVALGTTATRALVGLRTVLSLTLLLGVQARASAALLGAVSLTLLAADRYRYYHHLFLLYVALLWLSLAPIDARFTLRHATSWLRRRVRGSIDAERAVALGGSPAWPLQFLRALTLSVYAAAGISKLHADWFRGEALRQLELAGLLGGALWEAIANVLGYSGVALSACVFELGVCFLLCLRVTRRGAVLGAIAFHAGISACMPVFSFGAQMTVLLMTFLVTRHREAGSSAGANSKLA